MKTLNTILAAALATTLATGSVTASASSATTAEKGEARLAKMLEGRVAGQPVKCITAMRSNDLQVIDLVGLVYDAGDTVYVARPNDPRSLGTDDAVIIERQGGQLCTSDVTRTFDRYNGNISGVVFLQDFVPYKKQG
ncbi:MAG: hypothetical protein RLZZ08_1342 [Pseudomonadota bacterium]|jgi:hypothetical protein